MPTWSAMPARAGGVGGVVFGKLLHEGKPLADCRVAMVPLAKGFGGYSPDKTKQPLVTATDEQGMYHFQDVPQGPYKLAWLPQGQTQWIRRIAFQPDVVVKPQHAARVKDIRLALRTAN